MRRAPAILACLLCLTTTLAARAAEGTPKAVAAESHHDFGTVARGKVVEHSFTLQNQGTVPLEISAAKPSCGCTVTHFDATVPPGGTGKIQAVVDTATLSGKVGSEIYVRTNDPEHETVVFTTQIEVEDHYKLKPGYARYNMVQGEAEGTISQLIWSPEGKDFKILGLDAPDYLHASFRPATDEEKNKDATGSQWHVESTIDSWPPVGPIEGFVTVHTDSPVQDTIRIPISGFVRPILHVTPPAAKLGELPADQPTELVFVVQNFATAPLHIEKVESTVPGVSTELETVEEGRRWRLKATIDPQQVHGEFSGKLVLHTDNYKLPALDVDLSGTVGGTAAPGTDSAPSAR